MPSVAVQTAPNHGMVAALQSKQLSREGGRLDRLLKREASDREIIEEFYLAALARFPSEEERAGLEGMIRQQPSRRQAIEDLVWALVSSREFAENH